MPRGNSRHHNFVIHKEDVPSRFVIDLKLKQAEEERVEKIKRESKFGYRIKKLLASGKTYFSDTNKNLVKAGKGVWFKTGQLPLEKHSTVPIVRLPERLSLKNKLPQRWQDILNQLALIDALRLLFYLAKKAWWLIYNLSYLIGYTVIFLARFIYFTALAVIKPIVKLAKLIRPEIFQLMSNSGKAAYFTWSALVAAQTSIKQRLNAGFNRVKEKEREIIELPEKVLPRLHLEPARLVPQPKIVYFKKVVIFAAVLMIMILPIKAFTYYRSLDSVRGKVLGASEQAVGQLIAGGQQALNQQFSQAGQSFFAAGENFLAAQDELKDINGLLFSLAAIAPNQDLRLAAASKDIVTAGNLSAELGQSLSQAMSALFNTVNQNASSTVAIDDILAKLTSSGHEAVNQANELSRILTQINPNILPPSYRQQFSSLQQEADTMSQGLGQFIGLADQLANFLGVNQDKRYLLVFQNNAELRASGGFIGSYAIVDLKQGKIKNLEVPGGGSYDTEGGLLVKVAAPEPLWLVNPLWHFWDANWWPDWPTTAKKLAWFYQNSDGATVDGVIGFTPTVMEKLLAIIGPIDLTKEYGLTITADNFWLETQKLAEQKPPETNQPKKIIGDLMNRIIDELPKRLTKDNLLPLIKLLEQCTSDKNILFYFFDPALEKQIADLGWDGGIKDTASDYLSVIDTNIAGGKSDRKIEQTIEHQTEVSADGSIVDNLVIKRHHTAINREPFMGVRNVDWLRVYVPLGSQLISAQGFKPVDQIFFEKADPAWPTDDTVAAGEAKATVDQASGTKIYDELSKTVFANWSQVDPGQTTVITLRYKLPFKIVKPEVSEARSFTQNLIDSTMAVLNPMQKQLYPYSLMVQKQPGMNSSTVSSALTLDGNYKIVWKYPETLETDATNWSVSESQDQDKFYAVLLEQ